MCGRWRVSKIRESRQATKARTSSGLAAQADIRAQVADDPINTCRYGGGQFELTQRGVIFTGTDHEGIQKAPVWVCSPLGVIAKTRDGKFPYLVTVSSPWIRFTRLRYSRTLSPDMRVFCVPVTSSTFWSEPVTGLATTAVSCSKAWDLLVLR